MSSLPAALPPDAAPPHDRVLVVAAPDHALDLLRVAALRSDDVIFVAEAISAKARRFAEHFAVAVAERSFTDADLADATAVLLSLDDRESENRVVRSARRRGVPVHVVDRPLLSDFTVLGLLERPASQTHPSRA